MPIPWATRRIVETQYCVLGDRSVNRFTPQYRVLGCLWWWHFEDEDDAIVFFYSLADAQAFLDSKRPVPRAPLTPIPQVIHPYPPLTPEQRRAKLIAGLTPVSNPLCDTRPELADALKRATERIDDRSET